MDVQRMVYMAEREMEAQQRAHSRMAQSREFAESARLDALGKGMAIRAVAELAQLAFVVAVWCWIFNRMGQP